MAKKVKDRAPHMALTIERDALHAALARVAGLVKARETIPILQHVLLAADPATGLRVSACDMDAQASALVEAQVEGGGALCVPGKALADLVRRIDKGAEIALAFDGQRDLKIRAGRARFTLATLPADDFPSLEADDFAPGFTCMGSTLKELLGQVSFAMSGDETRPYICGVHLLPAPDQPGAIHAVATDGHRLALAELSPGAREAAFPAGTLPRGAVGDLTRWIGQDADDDHADVTVEISENQGRWRFSRTDGGAFITKLIDGTYPDYQRVIPEAADAPVTLEADDLRRAVELVAVLGDSGHRGVLIGVEVGGEIRVSMRNSAHGQGVTEIAGEYAGKERAEVGMNARYLLDALSRVAGKRIALHIRGAGDPVLIVPEGADAGERFVIMPMRVDAALKEAA